MLRRPKIAAIIPGVLMAAGILALLVISRRKGEDITGTALCFGCPDVDGVCSHMRAKGVDAKEPIIVPHGMRQR